MGTAMGTRVAPTFANIFMAKIDKLVLEASDSFSLFFKRFLDDIFMLWTGTESQFLNFMKKINLIHPTIKFTHSYNLKERSTTFLDTTMQVINGKLSTDLYRKETDKVQYLLPNSNHPSHIFKNIPFSLALRLLRICSSRENLIKRLEELKVMLLSRKYNKGVINAAIKRALEIDRREGLNKVTKKLNDRVICALTFNPKLPSISHILHKHWKTMTTDNKMLKIFPKPPMVAFRQPANLKSMLVRAKLPSKQKEKIIILGMKPCHNPCNTCLYVSTTKVAKSSHTKEIDTIKGSFNCNTSGIIYITTCEKCKKQYIGQTGRKLRDRFGEHLYNICQKKEVTGVHYTSSGHSHWDLKVQVLEKVTPNTPSFRLEREEYWIKKFCKKAPIGLNKYD
jgi:hypothetical protein